MHAIPLEHDAPILADLGDTVFTAPEVDLADGHAGLKDVPYAVRRRIAQLLAAGVGALEDLESNSRPSQ